MNQRSFCLNVLRYSAVAFAGVLAVFAVGQDGRASEAQDPCIVVWRYPGNAPDSLAGLELAVWQDGSVLTAASPRCRPGKDILIGRVDPRDVEDVLTLIRDAGCFEQWSSVRVVDSQGTSVSVRHAGTTATIAWTETLMPGVGGSITHDEKYRRFVRMWRRVRGSIESIAPVEVFRFEEKLGKSGEFRGFRASDPTATPWRPG